MTSDLLLDSCVLAKLFLVERDSQSAEQAVDAIWSSGGKVVVLDLALLEVANVIWKAHHRNVIATSEAELLFGRLMMSDLQIESSEPYRSQAFVLALRYDIAFYDALFVAAVSASPGLGLTSDAALVRKIGHDFLRIQLLSPNA